MYICYNLLLWVFSLFALPYFLLKVISSGKGRQIWAQKLGFLPGETLARMQGSPRIWVHAVSGGEVSAIQPLVRQLRKTYPESCLMLSTGTETGQKLARERVKEASAIFYFPLDLPFVVKKVVGRLKPDLFITAETELWPNFLRAVKARGARTMLANGRISERSFARYRKTRFFWMAVLDDFDALSMIRVQDGERIIAMGANPVKVFANGNCKYDQAVFSAEPALQEEMEELLRLKGDEHVFVAGSTHEGEEEAVIQAYLKIRQRYPDLILIIAPRHIDRAARVSKLLADYGIAHIRRSAIGKGGLGEERVVLWDTFGELFKVYSLGTLIFCGASLVPKRGQNILEPAAWGKAVLYGPSMEDFLDAHELLKNVWAGIMVGSAEELAERSLYFLEHPQELKDRGAAGKEALLANRGATQRNLDLARKLIET